LNILGTSVINVLELLTCDMLLFC